MFSQSIKAALTAVRSLFRSWTTLALVAVLYSGLLLAGYLFVNAREATISQLVITLAALVIGSRTVLRVASCQRELRE